MAGCIPALLEVIASTITPARAASWSSRATLVATCRKVTLSSILKQAGIRQPVTYLIVFEKSTDGCGAYAPDLPGLGVVGKTLAATLRLIQQGIDYLEELSNRGGVVPKPSASAMAYQTVTPGPSARRQSHQEPKRTTSPKRTLAKRIQEKSRSPWLM